MAKNFNRTLEIATDQTNVEPDWSAIMECIDLIRGKEVSTKDAANSIVKRLRNSNPHVVHHSLVLLEACMKNCGSNFHSEIISRKVLEELTEIIQANPPNSEVTKKLLEMIQIWNTAFGGKPQFTAIKDIHSILKVSGYQFPAVKESDHMFVAQCAPDWVDGNQCFRCRAEFSFFKRKHHCRACGQIFCDSCSSHQMYLPQFGIEKNVRVCDNCYEKQSSKQMSASVNKDQTGKSMNDEEAQRVREKELADKFEEDLQLALALSKSEAENYVPPNRINEPKKLYDSDIIGQQSTNYVDEWVDKNVSRTQHYNMNMNEENSIYRGAAAPSLSSVNSDQDQLSDIGIDTALAKYLDRDYWEKKLDRNNEPVQNEASAPYYTNDTMSTRNQAMTPTPASVSQLDINSLKISTDNEVEDTKRFCNSINELVETLDNRIKSNLLRGRNIINDSSIHMLFRQLNESYTNITGRMQKLEEERTEYEQLQDQLGNIQDARQAIDALRQEHERLKQERLLAEQRQRQAQMQHTLAMMRWQKKNTLNYQREKALERFHEQMRANQYGQQPQTAGNNFGNMQYQGYPHQPHIPSQGSQTQMFDSHQQQYQMPEMSSHQIPTMQFPQQQHFPPEMLYQQHQMHQQPQFMPSNQMVNPEQLFNNQHQMPPQQQLQPSDQQNVYPVQQNYM